MKTRFLRLLGAMLVTACLLVTAVIPSFASSGEGEYYSIDVSVALLEDGSAVIVEQWDVNLDEDWSEIYIPKTNLGEMEIDNLQVVDTTDEVEYTTLTDEWDIGSGLSTEDKRTLKYHKCGIAQRDDGGIELCWGVSGSGRHVYQLSYRMTNVVQEYSDGYDGFLIRFVNSELDPSPEHISVTVEGYEVEELTHDNAKFWAFGFEGTTKLEDGKIIVESDEDGTINYCNVMCRFDDGIFTPSVETGTDFRDLVETAFEGSDYDIDAYDDGSSGGDASAAYGSDYYDYYEEDDHPFFDFIVEAIAFVLIFLGIGKVIKKSNGSGSGNGIKRVDADITRQEKKDVLYSRDLPFEGSLEESYMALDAMNETSGPGNIMQAYLLKWIKNGVVTIEEKPEKRLGGLLGEKMTPSIILKGKEAGDLTGTERKFWNILWNAAGDDQILQEKELKKYSSSHYEKLSSFFDEVLDEGKSQAKNKGHIQNVVEKKLFGEKHRTTLTEEGRKKFLELLGFRKFLEEFTIINEREARDVGLWGDYLVYAGLFGIADEVAEQFKELVPDFFEQPATYGYSSAGWNTYDMIIMMNIVNNFTRSTYDGYMAGRSASEIHTASSGGGGFSSFGGGGGFSGGGVGGGGR